MRGADAAAIAKIDICCCWIAKAGDDNRKVTNNVKQILLLLTKMTFATAAGVGDHYASHDVSRC